MSFEWTGTAYQERQAGNEARVILALSLLVVFLFLAAQYESWSLPFAILLVVPLAFVGALGAQGLRGFANDIYCQIGLVTLIGLASKNSILIVEFAKRRHAEGLSLVDAAREAAEIRLRPVVMTAFAFILGVLPLVVASGAGAAARRSLGTTVFGGMLVATVLSLVLVPALFVIVQGAAEWVGARAARRRRARRSARMRNDASAAVRAASLAAAFAAAVLGCGRGDSGGPPPPEVIVATVRTGSVPDRREYAGNVRAMNSVEVRARVRGYLTEQLFEDGHVVKKGDVLFRIDPSTYQVALAEAKGDVARARAAAERARREFARAEQLVRDDVASVAVLDARRAERDAAEAEIASAEARVRAAELNLSYTVVRAPIAGRIGRALVDVGNLVGESGQDTVLAQIVQTDPIHVDFAPTERDRLGVLREIAKGRYAAQQRGRARAARCSATARRIRTRARSTSSTRRSSRRAAPSRCARACPTPRANLKPGEFVRVIVVRPDVTDALLVPQRAVQDLQGGSYLLVVKGDDTVESRPVTLGVSHDGMQQITEGVAAGERVVVEGVQKARPGQKVAARPIGAAGVAAQKEKPAEQRPGGA